MVKNNIIEKENTQNNLDMLYAESQIYSDDKNIFGLEIFLVAILPILLSLISNFKSDYFISKYSITKETFSSIIFLISFTITILDMTLIPLIINRNKTLAASIQDYFDCTVLSLFANNIKISNPSREDIFKYSAKFKKKNKNKDISYMNNWYNSSKLSNIDLPLARLMCQRTNCWWDSELRKKFIKFILSLTLSISALLIIISLVNELSLGSFLINAISPLLCLITFIIKQYYQHSSSINNLDKLQKHSDDIWKRILNKSITSSELNDLSRKLQDEIYQSRSTSPLIFDWFHKLFKAKQESQVNYTLDSMIDEYNLKNE